jgi:hypothetical protein
LPRNKIFRLTAAYIESLHDDGIAFFWPGVQPVPSSDCIDLNLLESAAEQPFQAGFGQEFYPTIFDKAEDIVESRQIIKNNELNRQGTEIKQRRPNG